MRALILGLILSPCIALASPFIHTFYGTITSYEEFRDGAWQSVDLTDASMQIVIRPHNEGIAQQTCTPDRNSCGYIHLIGSGAWSWMDAWMTFAGGQLHADEMCPGGNCSYSPYDPINLVRDPSGDHISLGDQLHYSSLSGTRFARLLWDITGQGLLPDGPLGFPSLQALNGPMTGSGTFSLELSRGEMLEGSYRGTFTIHEAWMPSPGTLALLGLGALVALRRRH